jgi:hypothetical protein
MNIRVLLKHATLGMLLLGVGLTAYPFVAALMPNAKAQAERLRLDISEIPPGSFKFIDSPWVDSGRYLKSSIFLLRKNDGTVKAWFVLRTDTGAVAMPDQHWWRMAFICENFKPTLIESKIDESKPIKCHDGPTQVIAWWLPRMQWTVDGQSLDRQVPDMEEIPGFVRGQYFFYGKP